MIDFPSSPTVGQVVTSPTGTQWKWDGTAWQIVRSVGVAPPDYQGFTFWQTAQPTATRVGDTWMRQSDARHFVWNGAVWFQPSPSGPGVISATQSRVDIYPIFFNTGSPNGTGYTFPAAAAPYTGYCIAILNSQVGYNGIGGIYYHVQFRSPYLNGTGQTGLHADYMTPTLAASQWWAVPGLVLSVPCTIGQAPQLTTYVFNSTANASWHFNAQCNIHYSDPNVPHYVT